MACNIIKAENERITAIPKVTVQDITKWMKADIEYVRKLVGICASLDKRNITDNILISDGIGFLSEREQTSVIHLMDCFIDYQAGKIQEKDFSYEVFSHYFINETCKIEKEELIRVVKECVVQLIRQVCIFCGNKEENLSAVLEIADLGRLSKEEFDKLKTILIGSEEEQEVKTAIVVEALFEKEDG